MSIKEKLEQAINLLDDMTRQADEDTPSEYRTRHFRECMNECNDFLDKHYEEVTNWQHQKI